MQYHIAINTVVYKASKIVTMKQRKLLQLVTLSPFSYILLILPPLLTFEHLIDVVFVILYPPVITQLCAQHLLGDSILGHINHGVPILSLDWEKQRDVQQVLLM